MLALVTLLLSMAQDPQAPVLLATAPLDAIAVTGTPELDSAAAYRSAFAQAEAKVRATEHERAQQIGAEWRPFWLPMVFVDQAVARWLQARQPAAALTVVDRTDQRREHEFGSSFQTTLWVRESPQAMAQGERELRRQLAQVRVRTLAVAGGTVVYWALLGLGLGWIDRLSRGYMTGRLRLLGFLLGSAVPAVAFAL